MEREREREDEFQNNLFNFKWFFCHQVIVDDEFLETHHMSEWVLAIVKATAKSRHTSSLFYSERKCQKPQNIIQAGVLQKRERKMPILMVYKEWKICFMDGKKGCSSIVDRSYLMDDFFPCWWDVLCEMEHFLPVICLVICRSYQFN
jgi:hypothetical protein